MLAAATVRGMRRKVPGQHGSSHTFQVGDRVLVGGGYDGPDSHWLQGGPGYTGTIRALSPQHASIELDQPLTIPSGPNWTFDDFGPGSAQKIGDSKTAHGPWLVVVHGTVGQTWTDPVRLHAALCPAEPDLSTIPPGGGIGFWVESHAEMTPAPAG